MKKLTFLRTLLAIFAVIIMTIGLNSCGGKEKVTTTTYQIANNMPLVPNQGGDPLLDNSVYEVWVDCYVGSSIVRTDKFDKIAPAGGITAKTVVDASITKIKISLKVLPSNDPIIIQYKIEDPRYYISGFTTIVENTNNVVTLTYDTPIDKKGLESALGSVISTTSATVKK
jgi:hypothetical protein